MRNWVLPLFICIIGLILLNSCDEEPEETMAEVSFRIEIPNLAPYTAISNMIVIVTAGPNDDTILATSPLTIENNMARGTLTVLAGKNRIFRIEARDSDNNVIGTGTAKVDVEAGKTITVDITIELVTGDVEINGHWGDGDSSASIVPGERMAGVDLLDPFSRVKELYGAPVIDRDYPDIFIYEDIGLVGVVYDLDEDGLYENNEPIIILMAVWPYAGETAGGNGIGSFQADVEKEMGEAEEIEVEEEDELEYHWYYKKGVYFVYDTPTRVVLGITIFPSEEAAPGKLAPKAFGRGLELFRRRL